MRSTTVALAAALSMAGANAHAQVAPADLCGNGYCDEWADEDARTCAIDCDPAERRRRGPPPPRPRPRPRDEAPAPPPVPRRAPPRAPPRDLVANPIGLNFTMDFGATIGLNRRLVGGVFGMHVGYRFDLGPLWISPEGLLGAAIFVDTVDAGVIRAGLGARVGVRVPRVRWLEPSLFAYGGGWMWAFGIAGPGVMSGLSLEARPIWPLVVGLFAAYTGADVALLADARGGWIHFVDLGARAGVFF